MSAQETLFAPDAPASLDGEALLALFHFFMRGLDHGALSLCIREFRPLSKLFQTDEKELKTFFSRHGHIGGYVVSTALASFKNQEQARRYAQKQIDLLSSHASGTLVLRTERHFPPELLRAGFPIEWIFTHPRLAKIPPSPRVAVVGSRESSPKQLDVAKEVAQKVVSRGGVVVTGMAAGADAAAYQAVRATPQAIIGVLGTGVGKIYPSNHKSMLDKFRTSGGIVLTELPPDAPGNRTSFILRNRIIASLADLVVTVSGKYASGTAHTIRFAKEMGTPIISVDPEIQSGITELVLELGGQKISPAGVSEILEKSGR